MISEKSKSIEKRLVAYTAAVGASLTLAPGADAAIVYYEGPWTGSGRDNYLISFNLAGDVVTNGRLNNGTEQFLISNTFGEGFLGKDAFDYARIRGWNNAAVAAVHFDGTWHQHKIGDPRISHSYARPFGAGVTVGPGLRWDNGAMFYGTYQGYTVDDYWDEGVRGYIGLRFDAPGSGVYYGWADITVDDKEKVTMWAYAYEDSGGTIRTGEKPAPIPLPDTFLLLASGAAGLAALRRRKGQKNQKGVSP